MAKRLNTIHHDKFVHANGYSGAINQYSAGVYVGNWVYEQMAREYPSTGNSSMETQTTTTASYPPHHESGVRHATPPVPYSDLFSHGPDPHKRHTTTVNQLVFGHGCSVERAMDLRHPVEIQRQELAEAKRRKDEEEADPKATFRTTVQASFPPPPPPPTTTSTNTTRAPPRKKEQFLRVYDDPWVRLRLRNIPPTA